MSNSEEQLRLQTELRKQANNQPAVADKHQQQEAARMKLARDRAIQLIKLTPEISRRDLETKLRVFLAMKRIESADRYGAMAISRLVSPGPDRKYKLVQGDRFVALD